MIPLQWTTQFGSDVEVCRWHGRTRCFTILEFNSHAEYQALQAMTNSGQASTMPAPEILQHTRQKKSSPRCWAWQQGFDGQVPSF